MMNRSLTMCVMGWAFTGCAATVGGDQQERDASVALMAGVIVTAEEDVTLVSDLPTRDDHSPLVTDATSAPMDASIPMDVHLEPTVSLYIQHLAIPRRILPAGGNDLPVIRFALHAHGGDIRVPWPQVTAEALAGFLTNPAGADQLTDVRLRDFDHDGRILTGLDRIHVAHTDDRQSGPSVLVGDTVLIRDDQVRTFSLTVDTATEELLASFREATGAVPQYHLQIGTGDVFVTSEMLAAINGRTIVIASNQPQAETITILPPGRPHYSPAPCNEVFASGDRNYLCGRISSTGAAITVLRLLINYQLDQPEHARAWHWDGDWRFEWDGEMLSSDFMEMAPADPASNNEQGTVSIRFRHEMIVSSSGVPFTLSRTAVGAMAPGEFLSVRLLSGVEVGEMASAPLTAMNQRAFNGWLGPHLWIHPTEACVATMPCDAGPCDELSRQVQMGWMDWSPWQQGSHNDEPCGVADWRGTFLGAPLRNVAVAP